MILNIPYPVRESLLVAASHALSSGFLEGAHESGVFLFSCEGSQWSLSGFMKIPFKEGEDKSALAEQLFGKRSDIVLGEYTHTKQGPISNQVEFFFYNP